MQTRSPGTWLNRAPLPTVTLWLFLAAPFFFPMAPLTVKDSEILFLTTRRKKNVLTPLFTPRVYQRTEARIAEIAAKSPDAVIILDIPLLLETGMRRNLAEVIVVYVPEDLQLQRLMARDQIDAEAALARIRSQMPIEEKRSLATIVIDNSGSLANTRQQSLDVFTHLRRQSKQKDGSFSI